MVIKVTIIIPGAVTLTISMGLVLAKPAATMAAAAKGDIERPNPPVRKAVDPTCEIPRPKSTACGVIVVLKAIVPAIPDPLSKATKNGPKVAPNLAIDCVCFIASIRELDRPTASIPAAKTPAAISILIILV